jgi:hypothetical protein
MANVLVRSSFQDIFDNLLPAIDAVYMQAKDLDESKAPWQKLFSMKKSTRQFENLTGFSGFGQFSSVGEGEDIPLMDVAQLHDKKFTHTKFAGAWQVTEEMEDDDKYDLVSGLAKAFSRSYRFTKEVNFANVLNNSGTTETSADGLSILNTAHLLQGGGSVSNSAGTTDFGLAAAQTAYNYFATLVDDNGIRTPMSPKYLVGHPANRWIFGEIMGSQYIPVTNGANVAGSDLNKINVLNEEDLDVVLWPEIVDQDAWWMIASPEATGGWGLIGYDRQPFTSSTDFDVRNLTMISVARGRWSRGCYDWRGVYGSAA